MNTIVNFAHILSQGEVGNVTNKQIDYLERIEKSGWHSVSVLNDLLDLAQMNAGEFRLRRQQFDLELVCEDAMNSVRSLLRNPDIEIVRDYPEEMAVCSSRSQTFSAGVAQLIGQRCQIYRSGADYPACTRPSTHRHLCHRRYRNWHSQKSIMKLFFKSFASLMRRWPDIVLALASACQLAVT